MFFFFFVSAHHLPNRVAPFTSKFHQKLLFDTFWCMGQRAPGPFKVEKGGMFFKLHTSQMRLLLISQSFAWTSVRQRQISKRNYSSFPLSPCGLEKARYCWRAFICFDANMCLFFKQVSNVNKRAQRGNENVGMDNNETINYKSKLVFITRRGRQRCSRDRTMLETEGSSVRVLLWTK